MAIGNARVMVGSAIYSNTIEFSSAGVQARDLRMAAIVSRVAQRASSLVGELDWKGRSLKTFTIQRFCTTSAF